MGIYYIHLTYIGNIILNIKNILKFECTQF